MKNYIYMSAKIFVSSMLFVWLIAASVFGVSANDISADEARGLMEAISDAEAYLPEDMEQPMTRRDFVITAAEVFAKDINSSAISFEDVEKDDPLYGALGKAVSLGWISDSQQFRPDDTIQLAEAAKICCVIAGYDVRAQLAGGYPNGYLVAADRVGIIDGSLAGAGELTVAQGIEIMGNTLLCDKLDVTSYGGESNSYATKAGETVLADLYDIYVTEGIINSTEYSAFGAVDGKGDIGYVQIDGVSYKSFNPVINEYLGYNVTGYYIHSDKNPKDELVFAYPLDNDVLEFDAEDITLDKGNRRISYGEDRIKHAKLKAGFEFVYNGRVTYDANYINIPADGFVTIIDNNDDGYYDVISVKECYYLEVGAVNKYYYTITDKYDSDKMLDLSDEECRYVIYDGEGQQMTIAGIENGNVFAVYASLDKEIATLHMCSEIVSGVLASVNTDEFVIGVDEGVYNVSPEFKAKYFIETDPVTGDEQIVNKLTIGSSYEFVIGVYGEVVKATSADELWLYAYLINAKPMDGMETVYRVKMFTQDAEHVEYDIAEKVAIGDNKYTDTLAFDKLAPGGNVTPQLIKFRVNADKQVNGLALSQVKTEFDFNTQKKENELFEYDFGAKTYYSYNNHMYPHFNVGGSIIFKIPATDPTDEDGYAVGYTFANGNTSGIIPYDIDMSGTAAAVVYASDDKMPALTSSTTALVVEKTMQSIDPDGEKTTLVFAYDNGTYVEYYLRSDCVIKKNGVAGATLGAGDIIRANTSGNYITSLTVDFIGSTLTKNTDSSVTVNSTPRAYQYHAGSVYSAGDGYMYVSSTKLADGSYDYSMDNLINIKLPSNYIICDVDDKSIRSADASYIRSFVSNGSDASYIVMHQSYLNGKCCVIYQND